MTTRSPITTHVLDTSRGCPARGMRLVLDRHVGEASAALDPAALQWARVGETLTNEDGRGPGLASSLGELQPGIYRTIFYTQDYFDKQGVPTFYPYVEIVFRIVETTQHYHIPLLISPYGYSTYRGS